MGRVRSVRGLGRASVAALAFAAAAAALPAASLGQAQPPAADPGQPGPIGPASPQPSGPANTLNVHGFFQATYTTDYITRGVLLENQGAIVQPTAELDFTLYENKDAPSFGKVVGIIGAWSSLHSKHEFAGSVGGQDPTTLGAWYEFDWYAGIGIDITPELNLNLIYQEFLSPSDAFGTCKNAQAKVTYNDGKWWEKAGPWNGFALKPYGLVFYEIDGKAGTGSDEGVYVEAGIAPSITFNLDSKKDYPLQISFPGYVGLGFGNFYGSGTNADGSFAGTNDETFGFVAGGVAISLPLKFMEKAGYGTWTYSASGTYYLFGDGVKGFNKANAGGGGDSEYVFATGINISF
jgi:hypothetical protein